MQVTMDSDKADGQSAQYWRGEQLAVEELCHRRRSWVGISQSLRLAGMSLLPRQTGKCEPPWLAASFGSAQTAPHPGTYPIEPAIVPGS
jgi:hypothetical protein